MDGISADRDSAGRFTTGNRAYDAKRCRVATKIKQLAADYDAGTPSQRLMLRLAAQNLDTAEITRNSTTRERASNVALRLLSEIPKRKRKSQAQTLTLREIEDIGRGVK